MLIFIVGLILFPASQESSKQFRNKICGLVVAMFGVIMYSYFEIQYKQREQEILIKKKEDEEEENVELQSEETPLQPNFPTAISGSSKEDSSD